MMISRCTISHPNGATKTMPQRSFARRWLSTHTRPFPQDASNGRRPPGPTLAPAPTAPPTSHQRLSPILLNPLQAPLQDLHDLRHFLFRHANNLGRGFEDHLVLWRQCSREVFGVVRSEGVSRNERDRMSWFFVGQARGYDGLQAGMEGAPGIRSRDLGIELGTRGQWKGGYIWSR
jgi:hypothetical protein